MNVRFRYIMFIAVILATTVYSCREKDGKFIDQGEIHYNIDYIGRFGVPAEALPRNLVVSFKNDKVLFEMLGLGNSGIINLSNPEETIYDIYYNFFGVKKYYYAAKPGELFPGFETMEKMHLKKTSKEAVICGYNCKNAEITFPFEKDKIYQIWYTNEIKVKNPNAATPFRDIDGVLMSFFFIMGSSEIHFNAETVYNKQIPDELFERREKFIRVSKENFRELMNDML